jgi:hypothetical protein
LPGEFFQRRLHGRVNGFGGSKYASAAIITIFTCHCGVISSFYRSGVADIIQQTEALTPAIQAGR